MKSDRRCTSSSQYELALSRVNDSRSYWAGRTSLTFEEAAHDPATNDDRTLVEVFEFEHHGAGSHGYLAYWRNADAPGDAHRIVTWSGVTLALITDLRAASDGSSIRFEAIGIDGEAYDGTYVSSEGDLVRLKGTYVSSEGDLVRLKPMRIDTTLT